MRLLLINGNTTESVTQRMADAARAAAGPETTIVPVTATFGARVISTRAENAIAAHAVVTLAAQHHRDCDAVLIGVSMDTALAALRELLSIPVIGMTEAAALVACTLGGRFGVISLGKRTQPMYAELLESYGLAQRVAGVLCADMETRDYDDGRRIGDAVVQFADELVRERGADSIVLAGAAMTGRHRELQARVPVPLLDGITCGVQLAELLARLGLKKPAVGSYSHPGAKELTNVDSALVALFQDYRSS